MLAFSVDLSVTENGKKSPKYQVDTDLQGEISLQEMLDLMQKTLITVAIDTTKDEQSRGFDKSPVVIVDNRRNKPITNVNPFGKIEVHARLKADKLLSDIYFDLLKLSPVDTGTYYKAHRVSVNGVEVAATFDAWKRWLDNNELKDKDIVRFVNIMPYAGFLERHGTTAKNRANIKKIKSTDKRRRAADSDGMVRRANGVYFLTARSYRRRFKGNVFINFGWMPGNELGLTYSQTGPNGKPLRYTFKEAIPPKKAKYKGFYVYPTITIRIRGEGIRNE